MNDLALQAANDQLAAAARDSIIKIEQQVVVNADPMENRPGQTVTQVRTNHHLTLSDRLGLYQTPGWHGLGEVIPEELSGRQAVERFIGWRVVPNPVYAEVGEGESLKKVKLPLKANTRSDTGEVLGVVSDQYVLVQNHDIGDFADALLEEAKLEGVGVRMETCGSLLAGRKVFLTMRPDKDIRVGKGGADVTTPLLTILNGHDGSMAMTACWSFIRVCCNNTYSSALNNMQADVNTGRAFKIRHSGKAVNYLSQAKAALGIAVKGLEKYQEIATAMSNKTVSSVELWQFFEDAYAEMHGRPEQYPATDAERAAAQRRTVVVNEWFDLMSHENQLIPGMAGTLWAAFNCITQWQDHVRSSRTAQANGRRDHLKLLGAGAVDKRRAFKVALETLSA